MEINFYGTLTNNILRLARANDDSCQWNAQKERSLHNASPSRPKDRIFLLPKYFRANLHNEIIAESFSASFLSLIWSPHRTNVFKEHKKC